MKRTIITVCAVALLGGVGVEFYRLIEQRIELLRIEAQRKQILLEAEKGWQQERNDPTRPTGARHLSQAEAEALADYVDKHPEQYGAQPKN